MTGDMEGMEKGVRLEVGCGGGRGSGSESRRNGIGWCDDVTISLCNRKCNGTACSPLQRGNHYIFILVCIHSDLICASCHIKKVVAMSIEMLGCQAMILVGLYWTTPYLELL
jgi:hypothetical protein